MRTKREFVEDFILARAVVPGFTMTTEAAKHYTDIAIYFWNEIEKIT